MATVTLGVVGAIIGGFATGGGTFNPAGARLGFSIGVAVGGAVDAARQTKRQDVGRLSDVPFSGSTYGAMIPQIWGRFGRVPVNIIWGGSLVESSKDQGSKLSGSQTRTFAYTTSFAGLVCKGPARVRRLWAEDILIYDDSAANGASSEVQSIDLGTPTSGTFSIEFRGDTTTAIAYTALAATVQSALEALASIGVGNILITGPAGGPWTANFTGDLGGQNVPRMDMHDDSLFGGGDRGIHTVQQGGLKYDFTFYTGTATQAQDPTMVAALGAANTPAYRNRNYFLLKDFPLALWGNRMPNLLAEVEHFSGLTALVTDSFNRADGLIGTADSGQVWDQAGGAAAVTSNQGRATAGNQCFIDTGQSDVIIELTIDNRDVVNGSTRVIGRYLDTNNYLYWGENATTSTYQFVRKEAGLFNTIVDTSTTPADGDVLTLILDGEDWTGQINGATAAAGTETFNQTETRHGFGSPEDDSTCDNFTIFPIAGTTITLAEVLADLFEQEGLTPSQYDVSAATDLVDGWALANRTSVREIADLLAYYDTLLVEVDGQIQAVKRGGAVVLTVAEDDLAARVAQGAESEAPTSVEIRRIQELELPFQIDVGYLSFNKDYEQSSQSAKRYTKPHVREVVTVNTGLALRDDVDATAEDKARQLSERLLYQTWTERETFNFTLPPRYLQLIPSDPILLPRSGNLFRVRITQMDLALPGPLGFTAVLDDAATLVQEVPGGAVIPAAPDDSEVTATLLVAWSGNALVNADADSVGIYVAAAGDGDGFWMGAALYWSRDEGESFQILQSVSAPATMGVTTSVLATGTETAVWDDVSTVNVTITTGDAPVSTSDAAVMSGENSFLVGDEVLQAGVITSLGGDSYELSHLLRGARGTDSHWAEHLSGERFVVLTPGSITRIDLGMDLRGKSIRLKAVANNQAIEDAEEQEIFIAGDELRSYSPVDAVGTRDGGNNLTITWIRRTRIAEGLQDMQDEPPGEDTEAYSVFVRAGTTKTITAVSSETSAVITSASHGYSASDTVILVGIKGMPALEGVVTVISAVTTNTFTVPIDTSGMSAYVSGGTAEKILRTISVTAQTASYLAATQIADGFTPPALIPVAIAQIGHFGAGFVLLATV